MPRRLVASKPCEDGSLGEDGLSRQLASSKYNDDGNGITAETGQRRNVAILGLTFHKPEIVATAFGDKSSLSSQNDVHILTVVLIEVNSRIGKS